MAKRRRYAKASTALLPGALRPENRRAPRRFSSLRAQLPPEFEPATDAAVGDVDGDGDVDLVIGMESGAPSRVRLYPNDGTGTFTDVTGSHLPQERGSTGAVVLADVDRDDDLDLIVGNVFDQPNRHPGQNRLYLNLLRQLDAPHLLRTGSDYLLEFHLAHAPPGAADLAMPFVAFDSATIPLPPLGVVGIDPSSAIALPPILIRRPIDSIAIPVPASPGLSGLRVHAQALLVPYPGNGVLTNVTSDVILH